MHESIAAAPSPRPHPPPPSSGLLRGIRPPCQSRAWGIRKFCVARGPGICQPRGNSRAFDTHKVSYRNITTQRVLLGKKADWLICQGQEKIEEGCKGMFLILCRHFFIAYQATITWRNRELSTWINVVWLLNQISVDIIWKTSFHIYKSIHNI